jgi:poly(glycerol-phosphate) alpha-glucosyltransferase
MYAHYGQQYKKLNYVNFFDANRKKVRRDLYDVRGFKTLERYLGDDQKVVHDVFYRPDGSVAIHKYYGQYSQEKSNVTLIELFYDNESRVFYSEDELIAFFLDCVARAPDGSHNIFISDRARIYTEAFTMMTEKAAKITIFHSRHKFENEDGSYRINSNYQVTVTRLEHMSALVFSTEEQKNDFREDFGDDTPVFAIPSGFMQIKAPRPAREVQRNKIINVARLSEEKRLDHLILAYDKIKDKFPDSELHFYGAGDVVEQKLRKLTEELGLKDRVHFRGYLNDLEPEYHSADLFVFTSSYEGFGIALLEAVAYGIPVVSYDIKYGPRDLIEDGVSGYLAVSGDIDGLAAKMELVLSDEAKKRAFGAKARVIAAQFNDEAVWSKWRQLLAQVDRDAALQRYNAQVEGNGV